MIPCRPFRLLIALGAFAPLPLAAAAPPAPPAPPGPKPSFQQAQVARFKEVEDRIAVLFQNRNEPKPDLSANPFRSPGNVPAPVPASAPGEAGAKPAEIVDTGPGPGASLALLQQGAATLRVTGNFEIGGQAHLVINSRPYKEGDVVQTQVQGETIYLRVKEISRRSVTLALNDAEMTLKY
jgi:hypothetical protein